ncbi:hypothetical protein AB0F71_37200 [Kitasatospora sp. NPDC028055]|uniref:hypothetical protein n=1 Tax=Kitasatospora sp. NPDC028055 TaxID=3155653 RepID=UPI0033ECC87C
MTAPATWLRGAALAAGLTLTGFGLYGLLDDAYVTEPAGVLWWAVGALVLHDGLWLPLVCLAGAALGAATGIALRAPRPTLRAAAPTRGPVLRGWLVVAVALTAVGLPAVLRAGRDSGNPTVLPLPYLRNWLLLLAATAVCAALVALARRRRRRRHQRRSGG